MQSNKILIGILLPLLMTTILCAQQQDSTTMVGSWLVLQSIPSITLFSNPSEIPFAFEWEATPLLYSFGMTKLISPWHAFIVMPPARFSGSIELKATGALHTRKMGSSYFGSSLQVIGHIPLIERGEYLALNLGIAKYAYAGSSPLFKVIGISTLFGFVELNLRHSDDPPIWIGSLDLRFF